MRTPFQELRRQTVLDLLEKYPDASSHTLAKIAFKDTPGLFDSTEDARFMVRLYRGKTGDRLRKEVKMNKYFQNEV